MERKPGDPIFTSELQPSNDAVSQGDGDGRELLGDFEKNAPAGGVMAGSGDLTSTTPAPVVEPQVEGGGSGDLTPPPATTIPATPVNPEAN